MAHQAQILISNLEEIIKKIPECQESDDNEESADKKSPSWVMSPKTMKKNSGNKGLL